MKSGDRLDQIEPLIAEMLIKIDTTSTKVDFLAEEISQLKVAMHRTIEIVDKQNDNISFLLKNQLELSSKIDSMDHKFDSMDSRLDKMEITQESILAILRNKN